MKRYWFDGLGYQLTRTRFDDLYWGRSIEIGHGGFELEAGSWTHRTDIAIASPEGANIRLDISRAKWQALPDALRDSGGHGTPGWHDPT